MNSRPTSPSPPAPASLADYAAALLLALLVVPSRLPVAGYYLGTWDSVQYALAIEQFNVALHQPHPPGYILLVGLLRAANLLLHDARLSMLAVNTLFGGLAVGLTYLLGAGLFSRASGLAAALLLLSSPTMWSCGATYEPYVALAGLSALVAWLCHRTLAGDGRFMPAATAALAASGGVRPDAALFLAPLWLLTLVLVVRRRPGRWLAPAAGNLLLLAGLTLAWYLPLLELSGGWRAYRALSQAQLGHCFEAHSVLFGASWHDQAVMAARHALNAMLAVGPAAAAFLLAGLPLLFAERARRPLAHAFLAVWALPAAAFYSLLFFSKPGYVLIYTPALALLAGRSLDLFSAAVGPRPGARAAWATFLLAAVVGASSLVFLAGPPPCGPAGGPRESGPWRLLALARGEAASVSRAAIVAEDARTGVYLAALERFSPRHAAVVCRAASPDWRRLMYYLRDRDVYWLVDNRLMRRSPNRSEFWLARGGRLTRSSTGAGFWLPGSPGRRSLTGPSPARLPVPLASGIEDLLVITTEDDPLLASLAPHLSRLDLGEQGRILRLHLAPARELAADRFIFTRERPAPAGRAARLTRRPRHP